VIYQEAKREEGACVLQISSKAWIQGPKDFHEAPFIKATPSPNCTTVGPNIKHMDLD
jgi:hypothetical protein